MRIKFIVESYDKYKDDNDISRRYRSLQFIQYLLNITAKSFDDISILENNEELTTYVNKLVYPVIDSPKQFI